MTVKTFRDLDVYKNAYSVSLEIQKASADFPKKETYGITDQMRRCSRSVSANIAEGFGRQMTSNNDFKRFLIISHGSCHEMAVWIDYCRDFDLIDEITWKKWQDAYEGLSKGLYYFIKSLDQDNNRNSETPKLRNS